MWYSPAATTALDTDTAMSIVLPGSRYGTVELFTGVVTVIFGSPTYEGSCSWQIKKYLDTQPKGLAGKLGAVFASQNWPGGGGASFAEMTISAAMLVHGMLVFSGGVTHGKPFLHFGAVARKAPDEDLYRDRCLKLGENLAAKAHQLFPYGKESVPPSAHGPSAFS